MFHWWVLLLWDSTPLWILHAVITDARLGLRVFWWHRLLLRMQMNRHYSLEMTEERESPKSWWWFRESLERQGGRIWRKAIFVSPDSEASVHRKQLFFLKSIQKHKHLNQTPRPRRNPLINISETDPLSAFARCSFLSVCISREQPSVSYSLTLVVTQSNGTGLIWHVGHWHIHF